MERGSNEEFWKSKQMESNAKKKILELRKQGKQGQINRVRRLILDAEF